MVVIPPAIRLNLRVEAEPGAGGVTLRWKGRVVSLRCDGREDLLDHLHQLHTHYGSTANDVVTAAIEEAERLISHRECVGERLAFLGS